LQVGGEVSRKREKKAKVRVSFSIQNRGIVANGRPCWGIHRVQVEAGVIGTASNSRPSRKI